MTLNRPPNISPFTSVATYYLVKTIWVLNMFVWVSKSIHSKKREFPKIENPFVACWVTMGLPAIKILNPPKIIIYCTGHNLPLFVIVTLLFKCNFELAQNILKKYFITSNTVLSHIKLCSLGNQSNLDGDDWEQVTSKPGT